MNWLVKAGWSLVGLGIVVIVLCSYGHAAEQKNTEDEYVQLQLLTDVLAIVKHSYVEEVPFDQLIKGAVRGVMETLDPHSSFMPPEVYREMQIDTQGEFGGLGIEVSLRNGELTIVTPMEGTPADRAGLQAGDLIVEIDEKWTDEMDMLEAVDMMRGPAGSEVRLTIDRKENRDLFSVTLVREIIKIESVRARLLDDQIGYLRVAQFQQQTAEDLRGAIEDLRSQEALLGLILDLRKNPGGLLDQAVAVSDLFLKEGLIVYTEGREDGSRLTFNANDQGGETDLPLVVLIDGGSASASEIVAGALQDQGRAVIVGMQSFGKGSVQSIIPLAENALRLTTARYFTPSGTSIQARGISPDIEVAAGLTKASAKEPIREADLEHHFAAGDAAKRPPTRLTETDRQDAQLLRGLDLLKGWNLLGKQRLMAN